jgi:cysteine desulfuration protein SufE
MMPPKLQEILDDLAMLPDRSDRIEALIGLSREYVHPSEAEVPRTEKARVPGCESEVFMALDGNHFRFAVDNPQGVSAMALAVILNQGLEGQVAEVPDELVYEVFGRELSMGKSMGLTNMVRMVRDAAKAA